MNRTIATHQDLDWLLDGLVDSVPETRNAVLLSDDGLVVSHSRTIERADAERLAAIATGQQSLARGVGQLFDGGAVHQVIVELAECWLFIIAAAQGTHLAVVASQEVDAEVMAVAMHTLVQQVGQKMTTPVRGETGSASPAGFDAFAARNRG
ncbi:putative regulator of Ras-like GTPase activity (Roadblock/LC7/MglB family) [Kitasatospora sp. MAA19]|uniref:roadblock/LC7 domain-containing protein n=1 Tax=unclassified Kitasatospora TaxID=2633591 RepID=UPI002475B731|nr:roadblock/LC7 domain-containing protein [Kitasatospora sp. MAA19]MDH6707603.1 putative regulator of Ras-like GTPase activity (Roadblock/LC7/MglB family) [Kitasatospora sp. MAA19]